MVGLLCSIFAWICVLPILVRSLPMSDMTGLKALYDSTNGQHWIWRKRSNQTIWNFTLDSSDQYVFDPCQDNWQGICCATNGSFTPNCKEVLIALEDVLHTDHILYNLKSKNSTILGLTLPFYNLSGSLPTEMFNMDGLAFIDLSDNRITRVSNLTLLTSLVYLSIANNFITGNILMDMCLLSKLVFFNVANNKITGVIPDRISALSNLTTLNVESNRIHGTLPSSLGELSKLVKLFVDNNAFTGSLPDTWTCLGLTDFDVSNNSFSGTIPSFLGSLVDLSELIVYSNYLTGHVPPAFGQLRQLLLLSLQFNYLTSTMPMELYNLTGLSFWQVNDNLLSGSIATEIGSMVGLISDFYLYDNMFSGTIPAEIGLLSNLQMIGLYSNYLSGSLPQELSNMISLQVLLLHSNNLVGMPGDSFSPEQQLSLSTVDLCDNSFTGTVPGQLFLLPNISLIALMKNCFSGPLPPQVCEANKQSLRTVVLDGLSAGSACQQSLVFNTYTVSRVIGGTIPECLFEYPLAKVLRLSGNMFTGVLPFSDSSTHILGAQNLRNLSISHNCLTGTIPAVYQERPFHLLDLSYNKLSGTVDLMSSYFTPVYLFITTTTLNGTNITTAVPWTTPQKLVLEVNQLSGLLPPSFSTAMNIQVVSGNLFGCTKSSGFPSHDPGTLTSQCGSSALNQSLYFWLGLLCTTIVILSCYRFPSRNISATSETIVLHHSSIEFDKNIQEYSSYAQKLLDETLVTMLPTALSVKLLSARYFLHFSGVLSRMAIILAAVIMFTFLPFELVIKFVKNHEFSSHAFQYAYTPSLSFIVGGAPAVVATCILIMFTVFIYLYMAAVSTWLAIVANEHQLQPTLSSSQTSFQQYAWLTRIRRDFVFLALIPAFDILVMVVANGCYLFVTFNFSTTLGYLALCSLVAFKLIWNIFLLPKFIRDRQHLFRNVNSYFPELSPGFLLSCLMLFNNVMVPCVVSLCTDPNCFLNVFIPAAPVEVVFEYEGGCGSYGLNGTCNHPMIGAVELLYNPPFVYNYQCSSSALANYVPVFVIMYSFLGFIAPVIGAAAPFLYEYFHTNAAVIFMLDLFCTPIMKGKAAVLQDLKRNWVNHNIANADFLRSDEATASHASSVTQVQQVGLLNAESLAACFLCNIATLITFGAAYPLLAVLIAFAIVVQTQEWRLLVGRYLQLAHDMSPDVQASMLCYLEYSCAGITGILGKIKWVMLLFMSLFYSFFLLDMTENKAIAISADVLWFPAVLLCWPVAIWLCSKVISMRSVAIDSPRSSKALSMRLFGLSTSSTSTGPHSMRMASAAREDSQENPMQSELLI